MYWLHHPSGGQGRPSILVDQFHYTWMDGMPYVMSMWNSNEFLHAVKIITHDPSHESALFEEIRVDQLEETHQLICFLMITVMPHKDFMHWQHIPCNKAHTQSLVICEERKEHEQDNLNQREGSLDNLNQREGSLNNLNQREGSLNFFNSLVDYLPAQVKLIRYIPAQCNKNFIFWNESCILILQLSATSEVHTMSLTHCTNNFLTPIQTANSEAEWTRQWMHIQLEKLWRNQPREDELYYMYGLKIRQGKRCSYVHRTVTHDKAEWHIHHDCSSVKHIYLFVCVCASTVTHNVVFRGYQWIVRIYNSSCEIISCHSLVIPNSLVRMPYDTARNQLSNYLSKLPNNIYQIGLPKDDMLHHCLSLMTERMNDPPNWVTVTPVNTSCQQIGYVLCSRPVIDVMQKSGCGDNHYSCNDGTCIIQHRRCNGWKDCLDGSDEMGCPPACTMTDGVFNNSQCFTNCKQPKCICSILYSQCPNETCVPMSTHCSVLTNRQHCVGNGDGNLHIAQADVGGSYTLPTDSACIYTRNILGASPSKDIGQHLQHCRNSDCPGMYKCYNSYCIPYRYVCDGHNDCPAAEEEENCEVIICPGLLKCIGDNVCISPDEVCDNIVHCPVGCDDETDCFLGPCPSGCHCFGLGVSCTNLSLPTLPHLSPHFKAIDMSNNVLKVSHQLFYQYTSLINLDLSENGISMFTSETFIQNSKLQTLNMDHNKIQLIRKHSFLGLHSLMKLSMKRNKIMNTESFGFYGILHVTRLDFSKQALVTIEAFSFWGTESLTSLNLSYNRMLHLHMDSLKGMDNLSELDISGNHITYIEDNAFRVLPMLISLISTTHGLCCFALNIERCMPQTSCRQLINSKAEKVITLTFGILNCCLNITAIGLLALYMVKKGDVKGRRTLYLHISDISLLLHVIPLLAFDQRFGIQFTLQTNLWYKAVICRVIRFFLFANIYCSSATVLVIVTEWYIITKFPFEASTKLNKVKFMLDLYWIIPVLVAVLDTLFLMTNHANYLSISIQKDMISVVAVITMIVLVIATVVPPVLTVILSSLVTKLVHNSIVESQRDKDKLSPVISPRLVSITALTLIRMFSLVTFFIVQPLQKVPSDALTITLVFFGAHVPSTFHPILLFRHVNRNDKADRKTSD